MRAGTDISCLWLSLRLAITIIFNATSFYMYTQTHTHTYTRAWYAVTTWELAGVESAEKRNWWSGWKRQPCARPRACRDLFGATGGRCILITRKHFWVDSVADRSRDSAILRPCGNLDREIIIAESRNAAAHWENAAWSYQSSVRVDKIFLVNHNLQLFMLTISPRIWILREFWSSPISGSFASHRAFGQLNRT